MVLTARDPDRLRSAADEVGARSVAAFDANDLAALEGFFDGLDGPIDHVMVTAGAPYYAPLVDMDFEDVRRAIAEHPMVMLGVARYTAGKIRPGGTLLFMGAGARRPGVGLGITAAMTAALPSWRRTSRSRSPRCASTSSPRGSSTPRCRRCSATGWTSAASSCARRCRSAGWSDRTTSRRWRCTS